MNKKIVFWMAVLVLLALSASFVFGQTNDKCPDCKGSGKSTTKCAYCNGTGIDPIMANMGVKFMCGFCKGSGTMICFSCNGTGKYSEYQKNAQQYTQSQNSQAPAQTQNPPAQTQTPTQTTKITCTSCGGTGLCQTCRGNYMTNCSYCNGVGKKTYGSGSRTEYSTCAACNGTGKKYCRCYEYLHTPGKCEVCKGKGYI